MAENGNGLLDRIVDEGNMAREAHQVDYAKDLVGEFVRSVRYRHAMEGELAETIETIDGVKAARVHLVVPKKSVFVRDRQASTASITIKQNGGAQLSAEQIASIVHLVSSSVENQALARR